MKTSVNLTTASAVEIAGGSTGGAVGRGVTILIARFATSEQQQGNRQHFLPRDGHLMDNPAIGPDLTRVFWQPANSFRFVEFNQQLTAGGEGVRLKRPPNSLPNGLAGWNAGRVRAHT